MTRLFFEQALIGEDWAENVAIEIDDGGRITDIATAASNQNIDYRAKMALPGLPNAHSHAFQRAMAGMAEVKGSSDDSFWTWRQVMYNFLEKITPSDLYAIAALAYCEMLESGFTSVCEFHYLHHDPSGMPYNDLGAMAVAIVEAADTTGIGPTLLPVFYANSQFGGEAPTEGQRRFITSPDQFSSLVERIEKVSTALPDACVGIAPHSLRAVTADSLSEVTALKPNGPIHIHIAEQTKEVQDCLAWSGRRPVEWLFEHTEVDERWCLIHATHLTPEERTKLATSGAVAGLCPITEANLGDGVFDGVDYLSEGGRIAVGSDSNVLISAAEELRLLEYSQRFRDQGRNLLSRQKVSTGRHLFDQACQGGSQASGRKIGKLAVGYRADIISLDTSHPAMIATERDGWLDSWIFAANSPAIVDVWVGGEHVVKDGRHRNRASIRHQYGQTMKKLMA